MKEIVRQRIEITFSKIEKDPSLMRIPKENLNRFKKEKTLHKTYLKKWEKLLELPINDIKHLMLSDTDEGEILRSTSVFIRFP